jgi:hypothetical protein
MWKKEKALNKKIKKKIFTTGMELPRERTRLLSLSLRCKGNKLTNKTLCLPFIVSHALMMHMHRKSWPVSELNKLKLRREKKKKKKS